MTQWKPAIYSFVFVYSYIWVFAYLAIEKSYIDFMWPLGRIDSIKILKFISFVYFIYFPFLVRKIVKQCP